MGIATVYELIMATLSPNFKPKTATPAVPDLNAGLLANIATLMNPTAQSLIESDNRAAAQNLASGMPGQSAFGQNRGLVLRDSEQRARLAQANEMYQPFLQRESAEGMNAANNAAENQRQVVAGEQAMERLRLSESGESARLNDQQENALRMQAIEGEQAMMRLNAQQKGNERLQGMGNQSDIQKLILSAYLSPEYTKSTSSGPVAPQYENVRDSFTGVGSVREVKPGDPSYVGGSGGSSSFSTRNANIDRLLAQYGLSQPPNLSQYNF